MSGNLTVESAYSDKNGFIGYRVTCGDEILLVFADGLEGFRVGDKFTPGIGESIGYIAEKIGPQVMPRDETLEPDVQ